jgi:cytochrome c peroxidase
LPLPVEVGDARAVRHRRYAFAICALIFVGLQASPVRLQSADPVLEATSTSAKEPITAIPEPVTTDRLKVKLGERLFEDKRLSHDNSRSCSSCHDISTNGAGRSSHEIGLDGSRLPLNTLTIFNAALNFRYSWEGKYRTLEADALAALEGPTTMGTSASEVVEKLKADINVRRDFAVAYGGGPDQASILDALARFERTLVTPGSRFDRWLTGDTAALSEDEMNGYQLFKSLGCISCHQGVNVGGNLFERHGIFHPLASPKPEILRVPSLRNVAVTAPYFHDGSALTLEDAVRQMAVSQLNSTLTDQQVNAIVAFLQTLTGRYRGVPVGALP